MIQFIPNQPIIFEPDTQYCKNLDNTGYAQLVQEDDYVVVQWKQSSYLDYEFDNENFWTEFPTPLFTDVSWVLGADWSIVGTSARHADAGASNIHYINLPFRSGGDYRITYTISSYGSGSVRVVLGDPASPGTPKYGTLRSANGTYTENLTFSDGTNKWLSFYGGGWFDIDNVYIESILIDNTAETYWQVGVDSSTPMRHVVGNTKEIHTNMFSPGDLDGYRALKFTIANSTAGSVTPTVSGVALAPSSGNGTFIRYFDVSGGDSEIHFAPTSDFDGEINIFVYVYLYSKDQECYVSDSDGVDITDAYTSASMDYPVLFDDNYITWRVKLNDLTYLGNPVLLQNGCYRIKIFVATLYTSESYYSTTVIAYKQSWGARTHLVIGDCNNTYGLGFNWTNFDLRQRIRTLRISPKYPSSSDTYVDSTGQHKRNYAQSEKVWTWWIDKVDEWTHDVIRLQIICDTFTIDAVSYFAVSDNYEPEWAENMKRNLSRSMVELTKLTDVLYKRSCI